MKRLIQLSLASFLLPAALAHAAGTEVDVFLLGGQSNAAGAGAVSELADPSVLNNEGVMLYHSPNMNSGQPARQWTTLRPASNSIGRFGPEIGFGNRMLELYPDRQIAIIKHAVGGTDLGFWFAQQGSIIVFLILIFVYAWRMNKLDAEHGVEE